MQDSSSDTIVKRKRGRPSKQQHLETGVDILEILKNNSIVIDPGEPAVSKDIQNSLDTHADQPASYSDYDLVPLGGSRLKHRRGRPALLRPVEFSSDEPKRGRGRPRVRPVPTEPVVKRRRGRPALLRPVEFSSDEPKRGRGRPRVHPVPTEPVVKRRRGRPSKQEIVMHHAEPIPNSSQPMEEVKQTVPNFSLHDDEYIFPVESVSKIKQFEYPKIEKKEALVKDFDGLKLNINQHKVSRNANNLVNLRQQDSIVYHRKNNSRLEEIIRQENSSYDFTNSVNKSDKTRQDLFTQPEVIIKPSYKVNFAPEKRSKILETPENIILKNIQRSFLMLVYIVGLSFVSVGKVIFWSTKIAWLIVTSPFKFLDFIIDRSLKGIWQIFKFIIVLFYKLLASIVTKIYRIFTSFGGTLVRDRVVSRTSLVEFFTPKRLQPGWVKMLASFVLLAFLVTAPLSILTYYHNNLAETKSKVLGDSTEALAYLKAGSADLKDFDLTNANLGFVNAQNSFLSAKNEINKLGIITSQLIKIIPQGKQGYDLLRVGELSSEVAQDLTTIFENFAKSAQFQTVSLGDIGNAKTNEENAEKKNPQDNQLISKILNLQAGFGGVEVKLTEINRLLSGIDPSILPEDQAAKLVVVQKWLPQLNLAVDNFKEFTNFMITFLGGQEKRRYLVIFQNNAELRPTGGFMGSFALVDINKGKIESVDVAGGGFYDLKGSSTVRVEAPKPFHLFSPYWQIWNANWFPDFPQSAEKIKWFYEHSGGSTVDGIVTLTPDIIVELLKLTGPIDMPAYDKVLDHNNFVEELQKAVELEYDTEENKPKQIISDMTPILLDRIFSLDGAQFMKVVGIMSDGLNNKNILIHSFREQESNLLTSWGWSGDIKQTSKDYLMVVHTNIRGGKTDKVIKNDIEVKTEVDNEGNIYNTVILSRKHEGRPGVAFEDQNNVDYVRFYVPQGSELILADNFDKIPPSAYKTATDGEGELEIDPDLSVIEKNPIIDERSGTRIIQEFGKTSFGNWLMVEPGKTKVVTIKYKLPFKFSQPESKKNIIMSSIGALFGQAERKDMTSYSLFIQKQAGDMNTEFIHTLSFVDDWQVVDQNTNSKLDILGHNIHFTGDLNEDRYMGVVLEK